MDVIRAKARLETKTAKNRAEVIAGFSMVVNKLSLENDSNTPDFIIAEYLYDCLINFHATVSQRIVWYNPEDKR